MADGWRADAGRGDGGRGGGSTCSDRGGGRWPRQQSGNAAEGKVDSAGEGPGTSSARPGRLEVTEPYSEADWLEHVIDFPGSRILARIRSHLLFNIAFATLVATVQRCILATKSERVSVLFATIPKISPPPFTLLGAFSPVLGLLLVFRTTAAYDRWTAGHRCVRETRHHIAQLRRLSRLWMSDEGLAWMDGQLQQFPAHLGAFLTGRFGAAGSRRGRDPRAVLVEVGEGVRQRLGPDPGCALMYAEDRMQGHVSSALSSVEEMAQLVSVAVAREYSRHTSRFLTVYLLILPFALIELGAWMPVAVAIISWALLGTEEIGHTLEDPFNSPTNPVPVRECLEEPLGGDPLLSAR